MSVRERWQVTSNGELHVNSLHHRNQKKARVKAAQSITLSTESVNWGCNAAWRNLSSFTVTSSQATVFTYTQRCDKDPGSGWSRDTPKSGILLISDLYFIGNGW